MLLLLFAQAAPGGNVVIDGSWFAGVVGGGITAFGTAVVLATRMILAYLTKRDEDNKAYLEKRDALEQRQADLHQKNTEVLVKALGESTTALLLVRESMDEQCDASRKMRHAVGDLAHAAGMKKALADARERNGLPREEPPARKQETE